MARNSIDPQFVKKGDPMTAKWANDLVGAIRSTKADVDSRPFIRDHDANPFAPFVFEKVAVGDDSDGWYIKIEKGVVTEITEETNESHDIVYSGNWLDLGTNSYNESGSAPLSDYPLIQAEPDHSLVVSFESAQYGHGRINTGISPKVQIAWLSGAELEAVNETIAELAIEYIPSADDGEVIDTDPYGQNGRHYFPVLGCLETTGVSGASHIQMIPHHSSNISWQPDRRWNARDAYNTGDGLQWLQVEDNDPENHQPDSEPFIFRTITGQESGYQMVRNPEKCAVVLEYAGQTVEGEDDTATLVTGYNVLDDIDGSLTIKSGESELGKIEWSDGMMDTDDHVVVDIGGFVPNGPTGEILLVESGTTGTLIAADGGLVSSISSRTLYARDYQVCESGSPVTKTFLTLD